MKKLLALFTAVLLIVTLAAGCTAAPADDSTDNTTTTTAAPVKTDVRMATIQGPTGIGMVHLMAAQDAKTTANDYTFQVVSSPEEISGKLVNGEVDIAAVPTNMAAALYNKTGGKIQLLAVNTLGVLYMLENGDSVKSVADLKGKTIYSTGEGANPEYILNYILTQNGLDPKKDVTIKFVSENTELAALVVKGEAQVALVPEPVVSSIKVQKPDVRTALSINDEWNAVAGNGSNLMMGCVAIRKEFADANKAAVDAFLSEYKTSIDKTSDVDATAQLCETYGIIAKAAIAKKAIPSCQLTFVSGAQMKANIGGYYTVLFQANPKSLGGKMPDDAFYYQG